MEKRTKAQGAGHPQGKKKTNQNPTVACNNEKWMQCIEEDDSKVELKNGRAGSCRGDPRNAQSQNVTRGEDIIEDKADDSFLGMLLVDLSPPRGGSSN